MLVTSTLLLTACGISTVSEEQKSTYTLTVNIDPTGAGSVSPPGGKYESSIQVTLNATPASNYVFDYWDGSVSATSSTTIVNMSSDKNVTAHFKFKTSETTTAVSPTETPTPDTPSTSAELMEIPNKVEITMTNTTNQLKFLFNFFKDDTPITFNRNESIVIFSVFKRCTDGSEVHFGELVIEGFSGPDEIILENVNLENTDFIRVIGSWRFIDYA